MSAVSGSTVTYNRPPASPTHLTPPPSATLQVPGQRSPRATPAEQYEMRVRSPPAQWAGHPGDAPMSPGVMHTPMATEDSFTTARDVDETQDAYDAYDGFTPTATQPQHHEQEESWRSSTYSYSGPHAI